MGGEGSGRKQDPIKKLIGFGQPAPTDNAEIFMPNLSGVQQAALRTSPAISGFTAGSVIFADNLGLQQDNANFYWDDTNNRLGIGTNSPTQLLHLSGGNILIDNGRWIGQSLNNSLFFDLNTPTTGLLSQNNVSLMIDSNNNQTDAFFSVKNNSTDLDAGTELFRIQENGNVGIGTTAPITTFHLSGGSATISNTTAPATPTNAGAVFVSGGSLFYIGSSGTVSLVAPA